MLLSGSQRHAAMCHQWGQRLAGGAGEREREREREIYCWSDWYAVDGVVFGDKKVSPLR